MYIPIFHIHVFMVEAAGTAPASSSSIALNVNDLSMVYIISNLSGSQGFIFIVWHNLITFNIDNVIV